MKITLWLADSVEGKGDVETPGESQKNGEKSLNENGIGLRG